ncbi:MAG TPA: EAL domain-containing response regulator [Steroidobacteraceae bacterium]|nr:EAL domain-containing response regulator [Steroidobacteraceae bacterium]
MHDSRLLILDDDAQIGKLIQVIAESAGVAARFLTHTDEFFEAVEAWRPTHIAIDLVMPEMDGVEVLVKLAERGCTAKIIITSGVGTRVLDAAGRSANEHGLIIAGVMSKPFSPSTLRGLLTGDSVDGNDDSSSRYSPMRDAGETLPIAVADLERALANREFVVAYQPQVQCVNGELAGFEALVRWRHPVHGILAPGRFILAAETNGLIEPLTDQVLDMALVWFASRFAGTELTISVNLSARGTLAPAARDVGGATGMGHATGAGGDSLVDRVKDRCRASGLRPENVILELTETGAMEDPVASLDLLTRLRMKGFQLSIDDFGTGYSSMLQLVRLPFSEIKVDKSFVMTATRSIESRAVVESIIKLGHSLGLRVVAEGVEDAATLAYLRDAGCDLAQGYFIAMPMYAADATAWLEQDAGRLQLGATQTPLL